MCFFHEREAADGLPMAVTDILIERRGVVRRYELIIIPQLVRKFPAFCGN
jgi:hypothetical protein